jgi:HAD superfamily phosphatase
MEDAPGKPNPTGLLMAVNQLIARQPAITDVSDRTPVLYVGDTVADMYTVQKARELVPDRPWFAVGVLPPHVWDEGDRSAAYRQSLIQAGAQHVVKHVEELEPLSIAQLTDGAERA